MLAIHSQVDFVLVVVGLLYLNELIMLSVPHLGLILVEVLGRFQDNRRQPVSNEWLGFVIIAIRGFIMLATQLLRDLPPTRIELGQVLFGLTLEFIPAIGGLHIRLPVELEVTPSPALIRRFVLGVIIILGVNIDLVPLLLLRLTSYMRLLVKVI